MSKNSKNSEENEKDIIIKNLLSSLEKQHGIHSKDVLRFLIANKESVVRIPVSIFRQGLSPLQSVVKHLIEDHAYTYSEVSKLLNRDPRTIWNTYKSALRIKPEPFTEEKTSFYVELSIFKDRSLSFLENLCFHMKENYSLTYHKIAVLLGKNDRTVWTVYKRAEKKKNAQKSN